MRCDGLKAGLLVRCLLSGRRPVRVCAWAVLMRAGHPVPGWPSPPVLARCTVAAPAAHLKNWRALARHLGRREHMSDIVQAIASAVPSANRRPDPCTADVSTETR